MKTKSIIYDIQTINDVGLEEAQKDFRRLFDLITDSALSAQISYKVRVDIGHYFCTPWGKIGLTDKPQLHIMLQGKDTFEIENILDLELPEFENYNCCQKYTFADKLFTKHNLEMFASHSTENALVKVFRGKNKNKVTMSASHAQFSKLN